MLSIFGILTTTYVAWYMTIAAIVEGPNELTTHNAPTSFVIQLARQAIPKILKKMMLLVSSV